MPGSTYRRPVVSWGLAPLARFLHCVPAKRLEVRPLEQGDHGLAFRLRRIAGQIANQHSQLDDFRSDLCASATGTQAPVACERYRRALSAHFELEEGMFFPALRGHAPQYAEALQELCDEHHALSEELASVHDGLVAGGQTRDAAVEALDAFLTRVRAHERREAEIWERVR